MQPLWRRLLLGHLKQPQQLPPRLLMSLLLVRLPQDMPRLMAEQPPLHAAVCPVCQVCVVVCTALPQLLLLLLEPRLPPWVLACNRWLLQAPAHNVFGAAAAGEVVVLLLHARSQQALSLDGLPLVRCQLQQRAAARMDQFRQAELHHLHQHPAWRPRTRLLLPLSPQHRRAAG